MSKALIFIAAMNGFELIDRAISAHISVGARNDMQVGKINAIGSVETNMHLWRYDNDHGSFPVSIFVYGNAIDLYPGMADVVSFYDPAAFD